MKASSFALLAALVLAGCAESGPTAPPAAPVDDAPSPEEQYKASTLTWTRYRTAPGVPAMIPVDVPEGATDVRFLINTTYTAGDPTFNLTLTGCGFHEDRVTNVGIVIYGQNLAARGDLCITADPGVQTLTVEAGSTPLSGMVILRADVPRA